VKVITLSQVTTPSTKLQFADGIAPTSDFSPNENLYYIHNDMANVAWLDGHVSAVAKGSAYWKWWDPKK
jgi:prepilin-type processing-associated H-X9-DG protein